MEIFRGPGITALTGAPAGGVVYITAAGFAGVNTNASLTAGGALTLTGALTCAGITATGAVNMGANALTCGAITAITGAFGTTPATTGLLRIAYGNALYQRNQANTINFVLIGMGNIVDDGNIEMGSTTNAVGLRFYGGGGVAVLALTSAGALAISSTLTTTGVVVGANQVVGARGAAVADAPAGGVGTAAGGWDTAANRDAAIATINAVLARLRPATGHGAIAV